MVISSSFRPARLVCFALIVALLCACLPGVAWAQGGVKAAKAATVHLKVKLANGADAEGSGFFVEPGLLITNAHVLNIHAGDKRLPTKIEVTVEGGEPTSKIVSAKYVGSDFDADLTLLRVEGDADELPKPLTLNPDAELVETQDVVMFGYPMGKAAGKNVAVSKSSISSLRKDSHGLKEVQLNGGASPGSSGGPVLNQAGEVIGVVVSWTPGTTMVQAVPGEVVARLLYGRYLGTRVEQSYSEGDKIMLPVRISIADPLKRTKAIRLEYWSNASGEGKPRKASDAEPEPVQGDGPIESVDLTPDASGPTKAVLSLPPLADDKATYWIRAVITDGRGKELWTAPVGNLRPIPVDRREVTLKFQPPTGPRPPVQVFTDGSFKVVVGPRTDSTSMSVKVVALPMLFAPEADGDVHAKFKYKTVAMGMKQNGEALKTKELWTPLAQAFVKSSADLRYSDEGAVVQALPDLRSIEPRLRDAATEISDQVLQPLELLNVPLQDRVLKPKDRLRIQRFLLVGFPGSFVPAQADVKYVYLGVRKAKDGRDTAMFEIDGQVRPRRGDDYKLIGKLVGSVDVALDTGEVVSGAAGLNMDLEGGARGLRLVGDVAISLGPVPSSPSTPAPDPDDSAKPEKPAPATKKRDQ
jgi:hypothetical protein